MEQRARCYATELERSVRVCFPSILSDKQGSCQSKEREISNSNSDTNMAESIMVCPIVDDVSEKSNTFAKRKEYSFEPTRRMSSSNYEQSAATSSLDGFREILAAEGLSAAAAGLITNSRRPNSVSNYKSSWGKWSSWCHQKQIDPFRCDLKFILNYLAELFHMGYEYRTINCHRSAISAYHSPINSVPVGKHPRICSLLNTSQFNNRPPKPRYTFIWDVDKVLIYLKTLPNNEALSASLLVHKLAMLLALTAVSRCSELCHLNTKYGVDIRPHF